MRSSGHFADRLDESVSQKGNTMTKKKAVAILAALAMTVGLGWMLSSTASAAGPKPAAGSIWTSVPVAASETTNDSRHLGTFKTPAEAEKAVLKATRDAIAKQGPTARAMFSDNCITGEAAHVCADWGIISGPRWDINDVHMWNPGDYTKVNFKMKTHAGVNLPVLGANAGVTRCWLDNGPIHVDDNCDHNVSSVMSGYYTNTLQVCVQPFVGTTAQAKATYTMTPYADALSNGCAF